MTNKKYYWLKLKEDFFEEDAISWIEEQENGKDYCLFYLKLCLKSLKTNGLLIRNVGSMLVPYDVKTLSRVTNTEKDTVRVAMELFKNIGLVQILENGEIYISQLKNMVGSETKWAEKKRLQRQKKDNVPKLSGQYPIEIDIEKENRERDKRKEIDIDIEKKEDSYVGSKENLKQFSKLYEQNIGLINGITAEWIIEMSETIDYKLFKRAIEIATDKNKCRLDYIKGIIKQWIDVNITTYDQLKAYELQKKSQRGVNSDDRSREGVIETESRENNSESEAARREELLRQIRKLEE
ncbi:phage replisome organizer N-terminal domain-containing protein [Paraclostridium bifermentans]|uniref:phage replisome organizer N-terminal domain-containing protein n=1 Tax=Paraclostridium bifermentans TaxID=1490 RepID=UPI00359CB9D2